MISEGRFLCWGSWGRTSLDASLDLDLIVARAVVGDELQAPRQSLDELGVEASSQLEDLSALPIVR